MYVVCVSDAHSRETLHLIQLLLLCDFLLTFHNIPTFSLIFIIVVVVVVVVIVVVVVVVKQGFYCTCVKHINV